MSRNLTRIACLSALCFAFGCTRQIVTLKDPEGKVPRIKDTIKVQVSAPDPLEASDQGFLGLGARTFRCNGKMLIESIFANEFARSLGSKGATVTDFDDARIFVSTRRFLLDADRSDKTAECSLDLDAKYYVKGFEKPEFEGRYSMSRTCANFDGTTVPDAVLDCIHSSASEFVSKVPIKRRDIMLVESPTVADPVAVTWASAPTTYALVVGVGSYEDDSIAKIPTAEQDAWEFKHLLVNAGVPEKNIIELRGSKARKVEIESALRRLKELASEKNDRAIVYFSGHGAPISDSRGEITQRVLVPYDWKRGTMEDAEKTGISLAALEAEVGRINAPVTVFLEACFSGYSRASAGGVSPGLLRQKKDTGLKGQKVFVSATGGDMYANWYMKYNHGLFTCFLLKGLNGAGDGNSDGKITLKELCDYLKREVSTTAKSALEREQEPTVSGAEDAVANETVLATITK